MGRTFGEQLVVGSVLAEGKKSTRGPRFSFRWAARGRAPNGAEPRFHPSETTAIKQKKKKKKKFPFSLHLSLLAGISFSVKLQHKRIGQRKRSKQQEDSTVNHQQACLLQAAHRHCQREEEEKSVATSCSTCNPPNDRTTVGEREMNNSRDISSRYIVIHFPFFLLLSPCNRSSSVRWSRAQGKRIRKEKTKTDAAGCADDTQPPDETRSNHRAEEKEK